MRKFALILGALFLAVWGLALLAPHLVPAAPVRLAHVRRGDLTLTVSPTTISSVVAEREARVAPEAGGRIVELPWEEGDRIGSGEVIARIDPASRAAQVARAEAAVAVAAARLAMSEAGRSLEAVQIDLSLSAAETALDLARKTFMRSESLVDRGGAARAKYDLERQNYEVALVSRDAKADARRRLDLLAAECDLNRALLDQARADLSLARIELERCAVRAPFAGVITRRFAQAGETAIPGQPLVSLIDPERLYVNALVDEVDIPNVRAGASCEVRLDAHPGRPLSGRVTRISPVVTGSANQTKTFAVRVAADPAPGVQLKAGQSCDVRIHVETLRDRLLAPGQAVLEKGGRTFVYVLREGRIATRDVKTGASNFAETEILGGLAEGEALVAAVDAKGIAEGVKAAPEPEKAP